MTVNKRTKNSRLHGTHSHGWGAKKKHRGAGNRGGRGKAGTGKRADQKKPSIWKLGKNKTKRYFGKVGFISKSSIKIDPINIQYIENHINSFLKSKKAELKGDVYTIDLTQLGFNKLLSKGVVSKKFNITVDNATAKAIEKVEKVGGSVKVLNPKTDDSENFEDESENAETEDFEEDDSEDDSEDSDVEAEE